MGGGSREFYISCSGDECWEILDALLENLRARDVSYRVTEKGIWIRLSGLAPEIRRAWAQAKRIAASTKSLTRSRRGTETSLEALFSRVKATFPPQVLEEVLNMMGLPTTVSGGIVRTAADPDTLLDAASRVAEAARDAPPGLRGSARRLVVAAAALLGAPPEEAARMAEDLGLLARDPDTGRPVLTREWRQALRCLVRAARRGETG